MPNRVWQFERPCPFSSVRWKDRNDAHCMKNMANAGRPKSAMAILPLRPLRGSGNAAQTAFSSDRSGAKISIPSVNHVSNDLGIPSQKISSRALLELLAPREFFGQQSM